MKLWEEKREYFPSKTPLGDILAKSAQLQYDNKNDFGLSNSEIYSNFDRAYNEDLSSFNNPKNLYTYFKLFVFNFCIPNYYLIRYLAMPLSRNLSCSYLQAHVSILELQLSFEQIF